MLALSLACLTKFGPFGNLIGEPCPRPNNCSDPPIPIVGSLVAPWCIRGNGSNHLGENVCKCTMLVNGSNNCSLVIHDSVTGAPGNVSYTISVYNKSIALKGAPNGTYWLCGRFAYYSLPPNWGGTCTVGFVGPAMRVLGNTETELRVLFRDYHQPTPRFNKRSLEDVTQVQTFFFRFTGVLLIQYVVACALDQIRDLTIKVEKMGNSIRDALVALNEESHSGESEWVFTGWLKGLFGAWGSQIAQW
ncbi:unnamed protein product, partial [Coregonus sp. 'balchen']